MNTTTTRVYLTEADLKLSMADLSEKLSNRMNDAIWKFIPIMISVQLALSSVIAAGMFMLVKYLAE